MGVASLDLFMAKVGDSQSRPTTTTTAMTTGGRRSNGADKALTEGDLVELECVAYNSRPAANITWLNGSESIGELDASSSPVTLAPAGSGALEPAKTRSKRLLQRNQIQLNADAQTFTTRSFLSIKLSRHEHKAQISCRAQNGPMPRPLVKSLELQVQRESRSDEGLIEFEANFQRETN